MTFKGAITHLFRKYQRWQYRRAPRPAFVPTVTPVKRIWSAIDERLERDLYLANPHAVWLRPDRHEHKGPCWQIKGFWEAPKVALNNSFLYNGDLLSQYQKAQIAQLSANQMAYGSNNLSSLLQSPTQAYLNGLTGALTQALRRTSL